MNSYIIRRIVKLLPTSLLVLFCYSHAEGQISVVYRSQPFVRNFTKAEYKGANQNWSITQDDHGVLYFGNTYGLLEFNGAEWRQHTHPDITLVNSVYADSDGRIYSGSYEEFGFWQRDSFGKLFYTSLSQQLLVPEMLSNSTIWRIFRIGNNIYLHSFSRIFVYDGTDIRIIEQDHATFLPIFKYRERPYVCISNSGLFTINEDLTLTRENWPDYLVNMSIREIYEINNDTSVVFTANNGIYLKTGDKFVKPGNRLLDTYNINKVVKLGERLFAVGTIKDGLLITDHEGNILARIDKSNGLQHNTILSLWLDPNNSLWIGLEKGIDFTEITSPYFIIEDKTGKLGSVTCAVLHRSNLYLGTNQGLFYTDWDRLMNRENTEFVAIPGLNSHVLSLDIIDDQLICGNNLGTYRIEDYRAIELFKMGGHNILVHPYIDHLGYQGIYTGIALYKKDASGMWRFSKILKETDNTRFLQIDQEGNLWGSGSFKGLQLHHLNESGDSILFTSGYGTKEGFASNFSINVFKLGNRPVFSNGGSFYTYDYLSRKILPYTWLCNQLGSYSDAHIVYRPNPTEYWFVSKSSLGQFSFNYDTLILQHEIKYGFLRASAIEYSENITKIDDRYYIIGLVDGLAILDLKLISDKAYNYDIRDLQINSFLCSNKTGTVTQVNIDPLSHPQILFRDRNLQIAYSVPGITQDRFKFYYRFSESDPWTDLGNSNILRYDNLRSGSHRLEIKAEHELSHKTTMVSFPFSILPPWYFHWIANVSYIIIFLVSGLVARKVIRVRMHHQQLEYFEKVRNDSEKKMADMRQEFLQKELRNKTKELINYTILLDKRNELLNSLKSMLNKELEAPETPPQNLKMNLLSIIDRNLSARNDWQIFKFHFDAANSDFLEKLRNIHDNLTPSDFRFCAFLRMNLTSKEIASLLSISLRSVEVKRYRLRKKLDLEHDQNLVEYLLSI